MFFKNISHPDTITRIAASGLFAGAMLAPGVWGNSGLGYPAVPLAGAVQFSQHHSDFSFCGTLGLALAALFFPKNKFVLIALIVWLSALCCFDLNRLQPWAWFYLLTFTAVIFGKEANGTSTIRALRWLVAGVYFWSGMSKITPYFAEDNFAWFCEAFEFTRPLGQIPLLGYGIAALEMALGAGLLWKKTRPYCRWGLVALHGIIVLFLVKLDWNRVVIPWNLAMAGMVWLLNPAPDPDDRVEGERFSKRKEPAIGLMITFAWLAPALYYLHLWPYNLSWQMYSNTQPEATFYYEGQGQPFGQGPELKIWDMYAFDDDTKLLLDDWATGQLRVPMFVSEDAFRRTGQYLCRCAAHPDSAGMYILTVNRWEKKAEKMQKITCRELLLK